MALNTSVASAYSATAGAWEHGPGRIYDRLAEVVVARCPVPLGGGRVLDVGAGTGAATRACLAAGAREVVAVDAAVGMLGHDAPNRPPAVAGDAMALPVAARVFDVAVAAFSINHLTEPAAGLRELARVTRRGGAVVAAAYAADDTHPVKGAVEGALAERGWVPEPWYAALRRDAVWRLASVEGFAGAAGAAGLDAVVEPVHVPFPDLDAPALVEWRLGMAQHAPFLAAMTTRDREAVAAEAVTRLGTGAPLLVRSILVLSAVIG